MSVVLGEMEYTQAAGQLRLLIGDVSPDQVLTAAHVRGFLRLHGLTDTQEDAPTWLVKRAAADALSAIATSEALIGKVIRTQDLTTDGSKVAAELRAQAATLRAQADTEEEAAAEDDGGVFTVAEFHPWRS